MVLRSACQFLQALWHGLGWGGHLYWFFTRLGFPCQNVEEIEFPSPVVRSNRHVAFRNIWHLFSLASSSPCIIFLINYSIRRDTAWDAPFDLIIWYIVTNSWYIYHMYFSTCFSPFVCCIEDRSQYYKIIFNTHLFSNIITMTLHDVLCPIWVQNLKKCTYWRCISISPASTHSGEQHHHSTTIPLYHLHTANIERQGSIRGRHFVVRETVTLI